jgi:hypothetical protein
MLERDEENGTLRAFSTRILLSHHESITLVNLRRFDPNSS